jgi:hypothetical protein
VEPIYRVGESRGLTYTQATALAASTGGVAEIDHAAAAAWWQGMADAAYGCGATLMGQSYAESAERRARGEG